MNFTEFINISELGFLIESPVLTTPATGVEDSIYIDPKTGKSWRINQKIDQLKQIKKKFSDEDLFVHFSNGVRVNSSNSRHEPKLGINPSAEDGGTPIGIYAYPIDYVIQRRTSVPYGEDRKLMLVFKVKKKNILYAKNHGKEVEDLSDMISLAGSHEQKKKVSNTVNKKLKFFEKFINKILNETKNELKENFPEYLVKYISNIVSFDLTRTVGKFEQNDLSLSELKTNLSKNTQNISNFFNNPGDYFTPKDLRSLTNDLSVSPENFLNDYLTQYSKNLLSSSPIWFDAQEFKGINLKDITFTVGEKKKSLVPYAEHKCKQIYYLNRRDNFVDLIISLLFEKYDYDFIFEKFKNKIIRMKEKLIDYLDKSEEQKERQINNFDFPFKNEFVKIAKENNVDIMDVLLNMLKSWKNGLGYGSNKNTNVSNFVYRFSGMLAKEISKKSNGKRQQYVLWTAILRKLGFEGIIDDATATIHDNEKTQSVFFDPGQLQLIAIVKNKNQSIKRQILWNSDYSPLERWFQGVITSVQNLTHPHTGFGVGDYYSLQLSFRMLSKVLIILHSYFRFAEKLQKDKVDSNIVFKTTFKRMSIYLVMMTFISNFENKKLDIKDKEILFYAEYFHRIIVKILNYINSSEIKIDDLPKPSEIRGIIKKLKLLDLK